MYGEDEDDGWYISICDFGPPSLASTRYRSFVGLGITGQAYRRLFNSPSIGWRACDSDSPSKGSLADTAQSRCHPGKFELSRARFVLLTHSQQRNKPKEPPKPPEKAPFFLPTLPGVEHRFAVESPQEPKQKTSKRLEKAAGSSESVFYRKLEAENPSGDCEPYNSSPLPIIDPRSASRRGILPICQVIITRSHRPRDKVVDLSQCPPPFHQSDCSTIAVSQRLRSCADLPKCILANTWGHPHCEF